MAILRCQLVDDKGYRARRRVIVHGNPHQFRTGFMQQLDLGNRRVDVRGVGIGHRLNHNWGSAADANTGNINAVS